MRDRALARGEMNESMSGCKGAPDDLWAVCCRSAAACLTVSLHALNIAVHVSHWHQGCYILQIGGMKAHAPNIRAHAFHLPVADKPQRRRL